MEVREPKSSNDKTSRHLLTRASCQGSDLSISSAFNSILYVGFVTAVILRFFSIHYSRRATSFFFGAWLALWPSLFEKINKTIVIFSGETIPVEERVLLVANHRTEVDWMYLWDLAWRKGCLGYIKYVLKSSLMKLPIFGWAFHILEFISVERKWEIDEARMHRILFTFKDPCDSIWLALFPEETDFTSLQVCTVNKSACKVSIRLRSQQYAAENGLPILKNVLLPKTEGFCACLEDLRGSLDAVYDVTIAYKHRCPTFLDNVFGVEPSEVHIHVQRITLDKIPLSEEKAAAWLIERFQLKDQLLSDFSSQGQFPHQGTERDLSTVKCLVNFASVTILIGTCMYLTFFSSIWLKIFVSLSCSYLVSATYFNFRPMPLLHLVKAVKG